METTAHQAVRVHLALGLGASLAQRGQELVMVWVVPSVFWRCPQLTGRLNSDFNSQMRSVRLARGFALCLVVACAIGASGCLWWSSMRQTNTCFLPQQAPAEWVVYPSAASLEARPYFELATLFKRSFTLDTASTPAMLRVAGFRRYSVSVNGSALGVPLRAGRNWKQPDVFEVSRQLRAGKNDLTITVFNSNGPPALWLALEVDGFKLASDESWQCSHADATWRSARLASKPKLATAGNPIHAGEEPWASVQKYWPTLGLFAGLSAALGWLVGLWGSRGQAGKHGWLWSAVEWLRERDHLPVAGLAALWILLFANNLGGLPALVGYDVWHHLAYIRYVAEHHSLPLAGQGWEMFQPPLYYVLSAALLEVLRLPVTGEGSMVALRILGLLIGVAHFAVVWASLRLLFPGERSKQLWGLLLAAFLPPLLYLSQYVTNEGLAAALVSGCIYLALRILKDPRPSWKAYIGLGCCLGAALLTKVTAVLAVPPIMGGLVWKGVFGGASSKTEGSPKSVVSGQSTLHSTATEDDWSAASSPWSAARVLWSAASRMALVLGVCEAVCGWHYARAWINHGDPLIGIREPRPEFTWWQDDGYRTSAYYLRFGGVLVYPWFGALRSFGDGLYSTLWGDGMFGGNIRVLNRPPWNFGLMAAGYWLALVPTAVLLIGGVLTVLNFVRRPSGEGFTVLGLGFLVGCALAQFSLALPSYSAVKAFYGLAGLLPLCVFGAAGFEWLSRRSSAVRVMLWLLFGLWAITSYASFWILRSHGTARIARAESLVVEGRRTEAEQMLKGLLEDEPQNVHARSLLAAWLLGAGDDQEAARQAEVLQRDNPADADAQLALATLLGRQGGMSAASEHARRAMELSPGTAPPYERLAGFLNSQGRYAEAAEVSREGLAITPLSPDLRLTLGCALLAVGDTNSAAQLQLAVQLQPDSGRAHATLGAALARLDRLDEAAVQYRAALAVGMNDAELHVQLGATLVRLGRPDEAINHYSDALRAKPDCAEALNNLAWIRAANAKEQLRDGAEAVRLAEQACQLTKYEEPLLVGTLAAAYAEAGRFDDAVTTARKARKLALERGQAQLAEKNQKLIELFSERKPFRESSPAR